MKILHITKEIYPTNKTGLGVSSYFHKKILKEKGNNYKLVTSKSFFGNSHDKSFYRLLPRSRMYNLKAKKIIKNFNPDLVIVESLQTFISELFIYSAQNLRIKTCLFSHGVSIFPYSMKLSYFLRFIIWIPYMFFMYLILRKLDYFFTFSTKFENFRNIDLLFVKYFSKSKIIKYFNTSRFEKYRNYKFTQNDNKILLNIGYVDHIKCQMKFVSLANQLKNLNIKFVICYTDYNYNYLAKVKKFIKEKNIKNVIFIKGTKKNIIDSLKKCNYLISTSITEVFPVTIIEALSLGKSSISLNLGNVNANKFIVKCSNLKEMKNKILHLIKKKNETNKTRDYYKKNFSFLTLKKIIQENIRI